MPAVGLAVWLSNELLARWGLAEVWLERGANAHDRGSFFASGHDKAAESAVILVEFGGVPEFIVEHGYGPDGKSPAKELERWRRQGGTPR